MHRQEISIANAKTHFSELINKVVYGHEEIIITKRGKPVAIIAVPHDNKIGLAGVDGWLKDDDVFFKEMDALQENRSSRKLRVAKGRKG